QIEELTPVTRDIQAMAVADDGGIEVFDSSGDVRLDRVGYLSCGGAFRAGFALGSAFPGLAILCLFRAFYFDHLASIKHNCVFLRGRVCEIHFLPLAHCLRFSDGILKEVRLMSTIA